MKDFIYYAVMATCAIASSTFIYFLLFSNPAAPTANAPPPASTVASVTPTPPAQPPEWKCDVTLDNFKQLNIGMTYKHVRGIFGCEGRETFRSEYGENVNVSYEWKMPGGPSVSAEFENDGLARKTWFGR